MKTLVVGDLHLKQPLVLPALDALLAGAPDVGRVVFLGDLCDDWGACEADELEALECQARWVAARRRRGLAVDVLVGNHDFCYVRGRQGPGSIMTIARELRAILQDQLHAQVACAVGPLLCSHAGLTGAWAGRFLPDIPREAPALAAALNRMLEDPACWAALDSCPPSRGGAALPGPLWTDLTDLLDDALPGVVQAVGHTPVSTAEDYGRYARRGGSLWACDTMSVSRYGGALGDGSLLLADDDGRVTPVPFPGEQGYADACADFRAGWM